jgi:DNA polymerase
MRKFLPGEFISRCHGQARWVNFKQKKYLIMPMYHPAAALRNAKIMADIREDFQKIPKYLAGQSLETEPAVEAETPEEKDQQLTLI